jgi:hypothetical protein
MSYFSEFQEQVEKGINNEHLWLPLMQGKLGSSIMFGKGMYFLFGGLPGSGKTAIVDTMFVLEPYRWWLRNRDKVHVKPFWIYRSMERSKHLKIAKWLSYLLFMDHQIIIDVPTLLGWPNKLFDLDENLQNLINSYKPFFEELEKHIIIIDGPSHPTKIKHFATEFALSRGQIVQVDKYNKRYVQNNPNEIYIHVTDHVGKIIKEEGLNNDKAILDKHSEYMGTLRDFYKFTVIDISQLNREIESTFRAVKTDLDVQPKDFKGTADLYENADVVIGLMNPYKLQVFDYADYDITKFINNRNYNRFRGLKVIKNSYGIDDFRLGYQFYGENGLMVELPKASEINYNYLREGGYAKEFINKSKQ